MPDDLAWYLSALDERDFETVHFQIMQLGASSKREGKRAISSFWAAVFRSVQREQLRRMSSTGTAENN